MQVRVLTTTDGQHEGATFTLPDNPTPADITQATGGMFHPMSVIPINGGKKLRILNSHYVAIVEIL